MCRVQARTPVCVLFSHKLINLLHFVVHLNYHLNRIVLYCISYKLNVSLTKILGCNNLRIETEIADARRKVYRSGPTHTLLRDLKIVLKILVASRIDYADRFSHLIFFFFYDICKRTRRTEVQRSLR